MSRISIILREMRFRAGSVLLSLLAVALAVATAFLCQAALRSFELETERMAADVETSTQDEVSKINNQIRKTMKGLGFNIFIYPESQDMAEVYDQGFASDTMPEDYVNKLASSKIVTVNHLLPRLTRKVLWKEAERSIMLIGVRGEVPIAHKDPKKPLINPVKPDEVVLGFELWQPKGLKVGDTITLRDRKFTISKCYDERGTVDDITVWVNLAQAQEMLELPEKITSILALQCNCASLDRLGEVRKEVAAILPGTRVIEKGSRALARAEARTVVEAAGKQRLESLQQQREQRRSDRQGFVSLLLPIVTLGSVGWIAFLAWNNVRERRKEIGTLRAMGLRGVDVLFIFLGKALVIGLIGGLSGLLLGAAVTAIGKHWFHGHTATQLVPKAYWAALLIATPLLAMIATWLPAVRAAQDEPVNILTEH